MHGKDNWAIKLEIKINMILGVDIFEINKKIFKNIPNKLNLYILLLSRMSNLCQA